MPEHEAGQVPNAPDLAELCRGIDWSSRGITTRKQAVGEALAAYAGLPVGHFSIHKLNKPGDLNARLGAANRPDGSLAVLVMDEDGDVDGAVKYLTRLVSRDERLRRGFPVVALLRPDSKGLYRLSVIAGSHSGAMERLAQHPDTPRQHLLETISPASTAGSASIRSGSFEAFLKEFDRSLMRDRVAQAEEKRAAMQQLFPLDQWGLMPLEKYAVGGDVVDNYCRWLEFNSRELGSVGGGSAKKWQIYKRKQGEGYYYRQSEYSDESQAWQALRAGLVRMFELAGNGQWSLISEIGVLSRANMLRLKSLHLYFPSEIMPIYSPRHLDFYFNELGLERAETTASPEDRNRQLLEYLRAIPALDGWSTNEIAGALYRWRHPGKTGRSMAAKVTTTPEEVSSPNHILFGPPGTGKTHLTTELALNICGVEFESDTAQSQYRRLIEQKRVFFVTFHQSFSYEDFVEGIRAETDEASGQVKYVVRDGVFKDACARASALGEEEDEGVELDLDRVGRWKVSLADTLDYRGDELFEECLEAGRIAIGYGRGLDFQGCTTREAILRQYESGASDSPLRGIEVTAIHYLYNEMEVGDLVIVPDGNLRFRALARVSGPASLDPDTGTQVRPVEWLRVYRNKSQPVDLVLDRVFSQRTIYPLRRAFIKDEGLQAVLRGSTRAGSESEENRNCVLIVDEINRANVARVLGELITLLEPDKRLGAANEKRVVLPYSREVFGIPSNLYVIGTMNTADRSIATLDVALRRRFSFKELMPDPDLVDEFVGSLEVSVGRILKRMNQRIEVLLDRDHTLGHAYFLDVSSLDDLAAVFLERVLPLLQEYFFLDWRKICLVLGCGVDEAGRARNLYPIVESTAHRVSELFGPDVDDLEDSLSFCVSSAFVEASGKALRPFFEGILDYGQ